MKILQNHEGKNGEEIEEVNEEDFEAVFKEFDDDDSNTIDKAEMKKFLKSCAGLDDIEGS